MIFSSFNKSEILSKIYKQEKNKRKIKISYIYGKGGAAKKIANLLNYLKPKIQKTLNYWKIK